MLYFSSQTAADTHVCTEYAWAAVNTVVNAMNNGHQATIVTVFVVPCRRFVACYSVLDTVWQVIVRAYYAQSLQQLLYIIKNNV